MICPLCHTRKARRFCPALNQQICPVCCATKRLTEIHCPVDCPYLAAAREHPSSVVLRRQQRDLALVSRPLRDLSRSQADLFFIIGSAIRSHRPAVLQPLIDSDVAQAVSALASTIETAERGVIYEHRPPSLPAERLMTSVKAVLTEGKHALGRDAAVALRRLEGLAADLQRSEPDNPKALLEFLERILREAASPSQGREPGGEDDGPEKLSPLIVL